MKMKHLCWMRTKKWKDCPQESHVVSVEEAARMVADLKRFSLENNKPKIVDAKLNMDGVRTQYN